MHSVPSIIEFITDPQLLGISLSVPQETAHRASYGLQPANGDQRHIFAQCCGGRQWPATSVPECTYAFGARGGKTSRIATPTMTYEAVFGGHERHLHRGERGVIPLVAQDARAARIAFGYMREYFTRSPLLASFVEDVLASEIVLANGLTVAIFPCTQRSMRGYSIPAGVMDELAFYRVEGQADSDAEVQSSIRRGMVQFPKTKLIKISTPYMKSGVLYDDFKRAFGQDDPDLLVWRASSLLMNPVLRADRLERERRLDPGRFAREYEAEFAEDVDAFLPSTWIDAVVHTARRELPPQQGLRYIAAVDASGGGADAFTLAIVHAEGEGAARRVIQDVMRGWSKPRDGQTDLEGAVQQIATIVKSYGISTVCGDRYAKGWVREAFRRHSIRYDDAMIRDKNSERVYLDRSAAYLEVEPLFAQGLIALLDHPTLVRELKNLERRPQSGGKDRVDHPQGQHDDHANAFALAAAMARQGGVRAFAFAPDGIRRIGEHKGISVVGPAGGAGQVPYVRNWWR
jgi:hypothetical protein